MQGGAASAQAHLAALRWLLLSPPLAALPAGASAQLASFTPDERASITQWLDALDQDPAPLIEWMHTRSQARIGRFAEQLLAFYLTHGPQHRLVAAHVPLRSQVEGITVTQGELDFLLADAQGQHVHWELAVKFFLCTATGDVATPADFIGPNGVETLAQKWHKLFAHQLTHTPPAPWNAHTWQPQAYTRGWMFYRWGQAVPRCAALQAEHGKGWWVDVAQMAELPNAFYAHLPRLHWMAPIAQVQQLGEHAVVLARDAMAEHLQAQWSSGMRATDAQMVVQLAPPSGAPTPQPAMGQEVQRFFIRPPA